jgi:hypothetical protein
MARFSKLAAALVGTAALTFVLAAPVSSGAAEPPPEPVPTTTSLSLSGPPPRTDTQITVTATVASVPPGETPAGGVDFFVDDVVQGLAVVLDDGAATVDLQIDSPGAHTIRATFNHQNNFASSSASVNVDVAPPPGSETIPVPGRPELPRSIVTPEPEPEPEADDEPVVAAETVTAPPAELPFTGAFAIPGMLIGAGSIGLGMFCRRYARRSSTD